MKRLLERTFPVEATSERTWTELVAAEQWPRWARHLRSVQVITDETGRVRITFTVDAAGVGVDTIGPLFARVYARNLDRAIPRLQAVLRSPDPARPK
jgi:hypothetical protein